MFGFTTDPVTDSTPQGTVLVPEVVPLFPMPRTVLLPGELMPLHVFEDRYRDLVRDALASHKVIGVVNIASGHEDEQLGAPPLQQVGCVGVIAQHRELEDGRYLIWLVGLERFRIDEELDPDTAYRQAKVAYEGMEESVADIARIQPMRRELRSTLPRLLESDEATRRQMVEQLDEVTDGQLIALATHILEVSPERKQEVLESATLVDRYMMIYEDLYAREESADIEIDPTMLN
jgi:Lon protease-like protein